MILFLGELVFADTAERTLEILRDILPCGSRSDSSVRVAFFCIVNPATDITYVLCHILFFRLVIDTAGPGDSATTESSVRFNAK